VEQQNRRRATLVSGQCVDDDQPAEIDLNAEIPSCFPTLSRIIVPNSDSVGTLRSGRQPSQRDAVHKQS
jgi:hypothetical protein